MARQIERNATYSREEVLALLAEANGLGRGEMEDKEWHQVKSRNTIKRGMMATRSPPLVMGAGKKRKFSPGRRLSTR